MPTPKMIIQGPFAERRYISFWCSTAIHLPGVVLPGVLCEVKKVGFAMAGLEAANGKPTAPQDTPRQLSRVCVYCGSKSGARSSYEKATQELGREMVRTQLWPPSHFVVVERPLDFTSLDTMVNEVCNASLPRQVPTGCSLANGSVMRCDLSVLLLGATLGDRRRCHHDSTAILLVSDL